MSVANEIDYRLVDHSYPRYNLSKINPLEGLGTVAVGPSGGNQLTFETSPNNPFNFAKSYLSFTCTFPAIAANNYWVPCDLIAPIREITVQSKGGLILFSIQKFDLYTKAVMKIETRLADFLTMDEILLTEGAMMGLARNDTLQASSPRYDNTTGGIAYTEPKYVVSPLALNTALTLNYKIPFYLIYNSILACDKDIMLKEALQIKVIFNSSNRFGWYNTDIISPSPAAINIPAVNITNPYLYLAIEKNQNVIDGLRQKVESAEGLNILFNYVYYNTQSFTASTQQALTVRFNRSNGRTLRKIYYCLTATETTQNTFNISNLNANRCVSLYDMLNNNRLVDYNISCSTADLEDYMYLRQNLKGSVLQTSNVYQYNWVWVRNFDDPLPPIDEPNYPVNEENLIQGLDLSDGEQKYDMVMTTSNNAFNHHVFSVCQKNLIVNQNGIQVL